MIRSLAASHSSLRRWMLPGLLVAALALLPLAPSRASEEEQDGLVYRKPATWDGGRKILGFYPPLRALERGYGDCDTKAALLAAILQNLTSQPMVGVHVPKHYLLGIAGTPRQSQSYILHDGRPYVLVEAAGPARRAPGEVAPTTHAALQKNVGVRVDPMI